MSSWLDIGVFTDRDGEQDRTSLVNKGFIIGDKEHHKMTFGKIFLAGHSA